MLYLHIFFSFNILTDKPSSVTQYTAPSHAACPSSVASHSCQQVPDEKQTNEDTFCILLPEPLNSVLFWHF